MRYLSILFLILAVGCATQSQRQLSIGEVNGGKIHLSLRSVGSYSQEMGPSVDMNGNVTMPINGVISPINADLMSTAMLGKSGVTIGNVTGDDITFEFEIVGSGIQNGKSHEIKTNYPTGQQREHVLIGELESQLGE